MCRSLDECARFNIYFHKVTRVIDGLKFVNEGVPKAVTYYNFIQFLGVVMKIPERLKFHLNKFYLIRIS